MSVISLEDLLAVGLVYRLAAFIERITTPRTR